MVVSGFVQFVTQFLAHSLAARQLKDHIDLLAHGDDFIQRGDLDSRCNGLGFGWRFCKFGDAYQIKRLSLTDCVKKGRAYFPQPDDTDVDRLIIHDFPQVKLSQNFLFSIAVPILPFFFLQANWYRKQL